MRYLITTTDKDGANILQKALSDAGQLPAGHIVKAFSKAGRRGVFDLYIVPPDSVKPTQKKRKKAPAIRPWYDNTDLITVVAVCAILAGIALKTYILN